MKRLLATLLALAALVGLACGGWWLAYRWSRPDVVLVVLDTVRADRVSVCDYDKPTTPTLQALVEDGAAVACDAYAPGSWTLPSHASFFTGLPVWEHGSVLAAGDGTGKIFAFSVHPLREDVPTLAERFDADGYRTVLISENSVVGPKSGLDRGFERVHSKYMCGKNSQDHLLPKLEQTLSKREWDSAPLFLVVNICLAHDPRIGAPQEVEWLEHHEKTSFRKESSQAFLAGELSAPEEALWLAQLSDSYDYSVRRADDSLGEVLRLLDEHAQPARRRRLVVTSDHGEMLGEKGLLDHQEYLWEPVARVPVLVHGADVDLPEPLSALSVFELTLSGELPSPLPEVQAVSAPSYGRYKPPWPEDWQATAHAAAWSPEGKRMVIDGQDVAFDLEADPDEQGGTSAPGDALQQTLHERYDHIQAVSKESGAPETEEMLRELGYVE